MTAYDMALRWLRQTHPATWTTRQVAAGLSLDRKQVRRALRDLADHGAARRTGRRWIAA